MELRSCEQIIRGYLEHKETLRWSGRPAQGIKLRAIDAGLIPFSLLWCGFAVFWEYSVITSHSPDHFFMLYGSFFVVAGLYFVFGRFIADAWLRSHTYYGITDRRIIIISGIFSLKIKSFNIPSLSGVSMTQKADGSGFITFGQEPKDPPYTQIFFPGTPAAPLFEFIQNVAVPFGIIRELQNKR